MSTFPSVEQIDAVAPTGHYPEVELALKSLTTPINMEGRDDFRLWGANMQISGTLAGLMEKVIDRNAAGLIQPPLDPQLAEILDTVLTWLHPSGEGLLEKYSGTVALNENRIIAARQLLSEALGYAATKSEAGSN